MKPHDAKIDRQTGVVDIALEVSHLTVELRAADHNVPIVEDLSLQIARRQTIGLVGESGCGKTMASRALIGVLPPLARVVSGSVLLNGEELLGMRPDDLARVRGKTISMIFQDPMRCLNPVLTAGDQIAEVARKHLRLARRDAWNRAVDMLARVAVRDPHKCALQYPSQLSGGTAQRVMIAMALVAEPDVVIADEPTTALDVTVQAQVLELLRDLQREFGVGILLITHDLGVIAEMCDAVAVMYAGQVVETAPVVEIFEHPQHPYTAALLRSLPRAAHRKEPFGFIPGVVPAPHEWPAGCRFAPRCSFRIPAMCDQRTPMLEPVNDERQVRCARAADINPSRVGCA